MLTIFTIMHPIIDACSVTVLAAGGMTWERVLAYNFMAFALQLPMGLAMDEFPRLTRGGFFLGTLLTLVAVMSAMFGLTGSLVLAMACAGNALFHLCAGKDVLDNHEGRGGPVGLFISTGALGLMAGMMLSKHELLIPPALFALAVALAVSTAVAYCSWQSGETPVCATSGRGGLSASPGVATGLDVARMALAGLFMLVVWRSWSGMRAGAMSGGGAAWMVGACAAVTLLGKITGGYVAERLGRGAITLASVLGSAALVFFLDPQWKFAWLAVLFVAQLATGPVLSLLYEKTGKRGGMAFGLNCLGLFVGGVA